MILKSVSVAIPNYNGADLLKKNLPLLLHALKENVIDFEIIVADDASIDNSVSFLKDSYQNILLIEHASNQGFSKNINSAIQKASKDLVLLLNTDVELTEDFFEHLFPYFDSPNTFGVMGMVVGIVEGEIQDAAKFPTIGNISIRTNINYQPTERINQRIPTLFLSGGWSLVDRTKLNELGNFNEIYSPFYGEDVDLSLRAWRMGYECYFEPRAICKHPSSSTIKKIKRSTVKVAAKRNKMLLHFIHLDVIRCAAYLLVLTFKVPFRLLILDFNYLKAYGQFLLKFRAAINSRNAMAESELKKGIKIRLSDIKWKMLGMIDQIPVEKF